MNLLTRSRHARGRHGVTALGGALAAAVLTAIVAPSATAGNTLSAPISRVDGGAPHDAVPLTKILWDQHDYDADVAIVSQNFEFAYNASDSRGADDFKVKSGWLVTDFLFPGAPLTGSAPVESANLTIYKNDGGHPGEEVANRIIPNTSAFPEQIILLHMDKKDGISLPAGRYWVSVQAELNFANGGMWGWRTMDPRYYYPGEWRNPRNGWGTGCTTYTDVHTCFDSGEGGDFQFYIFGRK